MRSIKLTVLSAVVAMGVLAISASAASAVGFHPAGTASLNATGNTTLTSGATAIRCSSSSVTGDPNANGDTVINAASSPTFGGTCDALVFGVRVAGATVSTAGAWSLSAISTTRVNVNVPQNAATVAVGSPLNCTITVNPSAGTAVGANGDWSNATHQLTLSGAGTVNILGTGSCPSGTATFTGTYAATSTGGLVTVS